MDEIKFETKLVPESFDYLAPDGSEIRLLSNVTRGNMVHCLLPPGATSSAVKHKSVEELWFCIEGVGELWRNNEFTDQDEVIKVIKRMSFSIPLGTSFQFRNISEVELKFIIVTMPPWPGADEAIYVKGYW